MYLDFLEITISDLIFVFHYFFLSFFSKWQLVIHDLFIYKERLGKTFAGRALFCSCIVVNRQFWAAYIVYTHWSTSLLHNTHVCEGGGSRIREGIAMGDDMGGGDPLWMVADRQVRQAAKKVLVSRHGRVGVCLWVGRNNADTPHPPWMGGAGCQGISLLLLRFFLAGFWWSFWSRI